MRDSSSEIDFTVWAGARLTGGLTDPVGVFAVLGGEPAHADAELELLEITKELEALADTAVTAHVTDPFVGAGGLGLAAFWDLVDKGADLLAWVTAAVQAAPRIRATAARLSQLSRGSPAFFSPSAIRALVAADVVRRTGLPPSGLSSVQLLSHSYDPPEPREELRYMYAAYTVAVSAFHEDYYRTWVYVVTAKAEVISESVVSVPLPNTSHWPTEMTNCRSLYQGPVVSK